MLWKFFVAASLASSLLRLPDPNGRDVRDVSNPRVAIWKPAHGVRKIVQFAKNSHSRSLLPATESCASATFVAEPQGCLRHARHRFSSSWLGKGHGRSSEGQGREAASFTHRSCHRLRSPIVEKGPDLAGSRRAWRRVAEHRHPKGRLLSPGRRTFESSTGRCQGRVTVSGSQPIARKALPCKQLSASGYRGMHGWRSPCTRAVGSRVNDI